MHHAHVAHTHVYVCTTLRCSTVVSAYLLRNKLDMHFWLNAMRLLQHPDAKVAVVDTAITVHAAFVDTHG